MNYKHFLSGAIEKSQRIEKFVNQHCVARWLVDHGNLALFYGIFLFLYEISVLRKVVPVIHPFLIAWAGLLAIYDILVRKLWKDTPYWKILLLFMVSALVTAVINLETGVAGNVKAWIMTIIPLVSFYPVCVTGNALEKKRTLIKAMLGGAIVVFMSSAVAIGMYLARISKTVAYLGETITIGFRYYLPDDPTSGILLYGLNEDTNHSAAYALVFAAYSIILILNCRKGLFAKKWINTCAIAFGVVNFLSQVCYFPLANSRGGWLSLIISSTVVVFLFLYGTKLAKSKVRKRMIGSVVATVCVVAIICTGLFSVRTALARTSTLLNRPPVAEKNGGTNTSEPIETTQPEATEKIPEATENTKPTEEVIYEETFNKTDRFNGGGRIWIWTDVMRLFVNKPILGNGPGNNAYYAEKFGVAPYSMGYGKAVHNSYLDLLLNYGVIGFVLMMAFCVLCVKSVLAKIWIKGERLDLSFYLVAFGVLLVAITSVFLSSVFINTTAVSHIMFVMVGYLVTYEANGSAK